MHLKKSFSGLAFVAIVLFIAASCKLESKTIEPFLIQVDSLSAPDTVLPKSLFNIHLLGIVGPNSCYALEKAYVFINEKNEIIIEVIGRYSYDGIACADGVIYLDTSVETNVPTSGIYTIKVLQQDNTYLEKELVAR